MIGPKGPVLIDLDEQSDVPGPDRAPVVPDTLTDDGTAALQRVAAVAARRPSVLARWFWSLLAGLVGFMVSLAAWDYANNLVARSPILGALVTVLFVLFCLVVLAIAVKEIAAVARLRRVDLIQRQAVGALQSRSLAQAQGVVALLEKLYAKREDTAWGRAQLADRKAELLDADGLIGLAETSVLVPLDARARQEVEAAARQVATVTAIVPLAFADVLVALGANLRMIRRIAEIYGGRSGTFGSWRLTRTVLTHLVATGAVAVGDDLIHSIAGGGVLAKLSRRFGEGVINGALTARVGVAAIEVCRPLPFHAVSRPSVTALVKRALTGLFGRS
jgi:putative membrane protein